MPSKSIIPATRIEQAIYLLRGEKVMLDSDLAKLYGVETRILVRNVKRHRDRFPGDFMFQLTRQEFADLKSQTGISSSWGVMRAFVRLRTLLASHADLDRKLAGLERKYDANSRAVFDAIRQLMEPPAKKKRPIGFIEPT